MKTFGGEEYLNKVNRDRECFLEEETQKLEEERSKVGSRESFE